MGALVADSVCGFCGERAVASDIVRGNGLEICRPCVAKGLAATLERTGTERDGESLPRAFVKCALCRKPAPEAAIHRGADVDRAACIACLGEAYTMLSQGVELGARGKLHFRKRGERFVATVVRELFIGAEPTDLVTSSRTFPAYLRADLQRALDAIVPASAKAIGIHVEYEQDTVRWPSLIDIGRNPATVAPLAYDAVDVGEDEPLECLGNTLWLVAEPVPHAILMTRAHRFGRAEGFLVEVATMPDERSEPIARGYFRGLEKAIDLAPSYRGKVLSLDCERDYRGGATGTITVHRLAPASREDVILPENVLALLERNVFRFFAHRERLRDLEMPLKKGLLFYGPPGTGKTLTIRYLAGALKDHTTLLVTAGEMGALAEYMALARLLSPAMVVIEDVDLIARTRENLEVVQESLLNRLLNEMDGLRENTQVLFVLTTNRVEALEAALAGRPGRIDQAIEFPLPDAPSRRRLFDLYRRKLAIPSDVMSRAIERTEGMSAAFIKELVRRVALLCIERDSTEATLHDLDTALGEMLFDGGTLNAKLLGARLADA
jgi:hypothetical protein